MENKTFLTAIELRDAIDNVPSILDPIGTCVSELISFNLEHDIESDEQEESEQEKDEEEQENDAEQDVGEKKRDEKSELNPPQDAKKSKSVQRDIYSFVELVQNRLEKSCNVFSSRLWNNFQKMSVNVHAGSFSLTIPSEKDDEEDNVVKLLFENAPCKEGTYGDVKAQETRVDESVRKARDYYFSEGHFECGKEFVEEVEKLWCQEMYPPDKSAIRAVPYKINVYPPDGMFVEHKDTPDVNMIGTFLVGLGEYSPQEIAENVPHLQVGADKHWQQTTTGSWCCFYTDVPHSVQARGSFRATLSFKIYLQNVQFSREQIPVQLVQDAKKMLPSGETVGFLLSHTYSHGDTALKGIDATFYDVLVQSGLYKELQILPVLVHTFGIGNDDYSDINLKAVDSRVYLIDDYNLRKCLGHEQLEERQGPPLKDIDFYKVSRGYEWQNHHEDAIEFTGNESRREDLNSLYIFKAIVAIPH